MPSYDSELRADAKGRYWRALGRKLNERGERVPHRFRLGRDNAEAKTRLDRLRELWDKIESEAESPEAAIWSVFTLGIASEIAKGKSIYRMPFLDRCNSKLTQEDNRAYTYLVDTHSRKFSTLIIILPDDIEAYRLGKIASNQRIEEFSRTAEQVFNLPNVLEVETKTLHQALDHYIRYLRESVVDPVTKKTTDWGHTQARQAIRIKERQQDDFPLHQLSLAKIKEIINFWRDRPVVKGQSKPVTPSTAKNHIKQFTNFLWWVHDSDEYRWKMPPDLERVKKTPRISPQEKARRQRPDQVKTFSVEDLILLYKYATPLIRLYLLLGMNCGFGPAEFGTLKLNEILLRQKHGYDELIDFQSSADMSWIKRGRWKSGVYGEWLLWPETVKAIEWAIKRRKRQPDYVADAYLCLTDREFLPYHGQTKGGNNNSRIGNPWWQTIDRIQEDHPGFPRMGPKYLRKTGGNKVRQLEDGEVMAIFHSRAGAVEIDDLAEFYSNRPFHRVFQAIQKMEMWLRPMFDAVEDPFPLEEKKGGANISLGKIETIQKLYRQGKTIAQIVEEVRVSRNTVYRHINR